MVLLVSNQTKFDMSSIILTTTRVLTTQTKPIGLPALQLALLQLGVAVVTISTVGGGSSCCRQHWLRLSWSIMLELEAGRNRQHWGWAWLPWSSTPKLSGKKELTWWGRCAVVSHWDHHSVVVVIDNNTGVCGKRAVATLVQGLAWVCGCRSEHGWMWCVCVCAWLMCGITWTWVGMQEGVMCRRCKARCSWARWPWKLVRCIEAAQGCREYAYTPRVMHTTPIDLQMHQQCKTYLPEVKLRMGDPETPGTKWTRHAKCWKQLEYIWKCVSNVRKPRLTCWTWSAELHMGEPKRLESQVDASDMCRGLQRIQESLKTN